MIKAPLFIFLALMSTSTPATARLHEVTPRFVIEKVIAIHRPTGCNATLEYSNSILIAAFITDPLCLPNGVKARTIPAYHRDFVVPASQRQRIRAR